MSKNTMEAYGVDLGPCGDSNVNVNIFWTNSPTKEHEFLKIAVQQQCSILGLRKKVLKLIMDVEKVKCDEQEMDKEDFDWDSLIRILTIGGDFLSKKKEYLAVGDFNVGKNQELGVMVQTKTCGLVHITLNSFGKSSFPASLSFDLLKDTLATLKSRIRELAQIPEANSLKISYMGKDLDQTQGPDTPILEFWNEKKQNMWYYEPNATGAAPFYVDISAVTGERMTIDQDIKPETTIEELKHLICKFLDIPSDAQRLLFAGQQLCDDELLINYNVQCGSTLHLVLRMSGGGGPPPRGASVSVPGISFADLSDSRNLVQRAFSTKAPDWRRVENGLNLEGICGNSSCKGFNQQVIAPRGFKDFHLSKDCGKITCPICVQPLKELRTCGFMSTFWRYFGRKAINMGELLNVDWAEAGDDAYTTFDVNEPGGGLKGMQSWSLLVIQTRQVYKDEAGEKHPQPPYCGYCFEKTERTKLKRLACGHIYHEVCTKKSHFRCSFCVFNNP